MLKLSKQLMPPVNMTKMKDIFLSSTYFDNPSGIGAPSTVPSSLEVHEDILHDEGIKLLKKLDACSKYSEYFEITQPVMMCLFSMILSKDHSSSPSSCAYKRLLFFYFHQHINKYTLDIFREEFWRWVRSVSN